MILIGMAEFHCKNTDLYKLYREEMVNVYVDIRDKLRQRNRETLLKIIEHDHNRNLVIAKLEEANRTEPGLMI